MKNKRQHREERDARILKTYAQLGSIKKTARLLHHSVNTVRRVLRRKADGTHNLVATVAAVSHRPARPSILDPFKPVIKRLVLDDKLTGVLVFEEIGEMGYLGSYSLLKKYISQIRPSSSTKRRATIVVAHPPGKEGQVDWSPYRVWLGGVEQVVHAFSMVLPFSSYMVLRFALNEKLESLIALHEEAFGDIGAIPPLMTYDNMTTVGRHVGPGEVRLNSVFEEYARSRGFAIQLTRPGHPNDHASVERHFYYVETNCLKRRRFRFPDLEDLNRHAAWWCAHVANVRIHGTTRERPVDRLQRERAYLLPLGSEKPAVFRQVEREVRTDFCVRIDNSFYSVPPNLISKTAQVRLFVDRIEIWVDGKMVAVHQPATEPYERHVLPEHEEAFKRCAPSKALLEQAFVRLGEAATPYYEGIKAQRGKGAGYHLQRILKLADRYGAQVVCGAMSHAARYGSYGAEAVARVIRGGELPRQTSPNLRHEDESPAPPERIQRWLEGIDVEHRDLDEFDAIIDQLGTPNATKTQPQNKKGHHGS